MSTVTLQGRVAGRVDQVDGDRVGVDDVVRCEEGSNLLMAGYHRVLPHVRAKIVQDWLEKIIINV